MGFEALLFSVVMGLVTLRAFLSSTAISMNAPAHVPILVLMKRIAGKVRVLYVRDMVVCLSTILIVIMYASPAVRNLLLGSMIGVAFALETFFGVMGAVLALEWKYDAPNSGKPNLSSDLPPDTRAPAHPAATLEAII